MRRAARVDENQRRIVDALRAAGCTVQSLAAVGAGCPDLLVGIFGQNHLLEIKNPAKPKADRKLKPDQARWIASWRGSVKVVHNIADAFQAIGLTQ